MKIMNNTNLTQKVVMFADGRGNSYTQEYDLYADEENTGVKIVITGNLGRDNTERKFIYDGEEYKTHFDALKAAGFEVENSE